MIIIPAILGRYSSKQDKTLSLVFNTNEPTPEQLHSIAKHSQKYGFLAFKEDELRNDEKEMLNSLKSDELDQGKSPSQRMRGVLFRCWEQESLGYSTFADYYNRKMEEIITHFKSKLD